MEKVGDGKWAPTKLNIDKARGLAAPITELLQKDQFDARAYLEHFPNTEKAGDLRGELGEKPNTAGLDFEGLFDRWLRNKRDGRKSLAKAYEDH